MVFCQTLLFILVVDALCAQLSITSKGSFSIGSTFSLFCNIPSFDALAIWTTNGSLVTACTSSGFCDRISSGNYRFAGNASGISVEINPLEMIENGTVWKCLYRSTEESFTIILPQLQIRSIGSFYVGSTLSLYCYIHSFERSASWTRNGVLMTICPSGEVCIDISQISNTMYRFASNSSGISVEINSVDFFENNTVWKCKNEGKEEPFRILISQLSITSKGSFSIGSTLSLFCNIPSFDAVATWITNGSNVTTCTSGGFCDRISSGNYRFAGNASGISVEINPLEMIENGTVWKCLYRSTEESFTIILPLLKPSKGPIEGLSGGSIAGIVTGVMALVITVIIILVMRWKPCPFQNTETFSNVMP